MDDLKSVTLAYLRDLARKHLGPGHSKLNKTELIAALAEFVPALKKLARLAGIELPTRAKPAAKADPSAAKSSREPRGKEARVAKKKDSKRKKGQEKKAAERKSEPEKKAAEPKPEPEKKAAERKPEPEKKAAEPKPEPEKKAAEPQGSKPAEKPLQAAPKAEQVSQSPRPAQVVNFPPRQRSVRSAEEEWAEGVEVVESAELEVVFQHAAEPLMEGFFVARLMGERELRRHHLTEEQAARVVATPAGLDENLGELPLDYGNDLALALARDPHTLFITWDFSPATLARTREGLESPRAMLRVFDGDRLVREVEFVPESRSFYIHGLPPGRPYRVEAHYVGREGRSRRLGHSTHPLVLPRTGPSTDTAVRFMRMPPPPQVEPVLGPASALPVAPVMEASFAPHEEIVEEREYISWRRVPLPGSDEMATLAERRRELTTRPVKPPERLEHLEISARPPGSSEQFAARGKGGASEQTHWTPPQSGRGR